MSVLRMIYLALAVLGAVLGVVSPVDWIGPAPESVIFWDLLVAVVALSVWVLAETMVRLGNDAGTKTVALLTNMNVALGVVPVTLLLGIGCGLPLYLFLRTRSVN